MSLTNGRYDDMDPDCSAPDPFHDKAGSYKGKLNHVFGDDGVSHSQLPPREFPYADPNTPLTVLHAGLCLLLRQEDLARRLAR